MRVFFVLFVVVLLIPETGWGQIDTFDDGSVTDGSPFFWSTASGAHDVVGGDLVVDTTNGFYYGLIAGEQYSDVTLTTLFRILSPESPNQQRGEITVVARGAGDNGYFAGFDQGGDLKVYTRVDGRVQAPGQFGSSIDPTAKDVWLELAVFDSRLAVRAWEDGDERPSNPQIFLSNAQLESGHVALFVDDPVTSVAFRSFEVSTSPPIPNDFDLDEAVTIKDFRDLCLRIGRPSASYFDLDQDGMVGSTDVDAFIDLAAWIPGDINLDGGVNFADFVLLSQNFETKRGANWSDGDFNCDRRVNFSDFTQLAKNFTIQSETMAVPEPHSIIGFALSLLALLRRESRANQRRESYESTPPILRG